MEERIFPHASSAGDNEGLEEERRLCYVAMTRAMAVEYGARGIRFNGVSPGSIETAMNKPNFPDNINMRLMMRQSSLDTSRGPEFVASVIAMLATSSLGAMWSSSSPDFGVDGVLDRFSQIEPKVLVCARGAMWNGSWMGSLERVRAISERLPSLGAVVVADYGAKLDPVT
jgi:hypothetical protein